MREAPSAARPRVAALDGHRDDRRAILGVALAAMAAAALAVALGPDPAAIITGTLNAIIGAAA